MNIKIGAIIKKLRAENNITQETLATAIGVTPQAISRWESEGGYPDIELLPTLADFFSVSTDELLGYKLSEREQELANDPSTWQSKIEMLRISNQLYLMIYGDDLMFHHNRISFNHWVISTYQMSLGKAEDAMESLEKMCDHAVSYDISYQNDHGKHFTSFLVDTQVYPEKNKDFHELTEHTHCYYMLDRLQHGRYDGIRQDPRFISIVERLNQYAK